MSWALAAFLLLALALGAGFAWYERVRPDARVVALVGTLAAFGALGRIAFAALPNVKPTTDIVLAAGFGLGAGPGFAVGAIAALSSNFFFGQGPWTPWQMAAWGATGVLGAGLARACPRRDQVGDRQVGDPDPQASHRDLDPHASHSDLKPHASDSDLGSPTIGRWPLAVVCGAVGFAFTAVQDGGDWVTYSDHSLAQLGAYVGSGLGFDAISAGGCVVFALAFGPALIRAIQRFARRLEITWLPPLPPAAPLVALVAGAALATAALGAAPHAARAATPTAAAPRAAAYLARAENADGGFGERPRAASAQLFSGWAALGLASAGRDVRRLRGRRGGPTLLAYIRRAAGSTGPGSLERTILVTHAAGVSATAFGGHNLLAALRRHFAHDGAIGGQVNLTTFGVLALAAAGADPSLQTRARRWLARQQDRDGGWNFAGRGGTSDADDSGAALEALATGQASAAQRRVRRRGIAYLRRTQTRGGGWASEPGEGANAQSTAWAVQGLIAVGADAAGVDRALGYLRSLQKPDGAIGYSRGSTQTPVWVTAEALMALERRPLPVAAPG